MTLITLCTSPAMVRCTAIYTQADGLLFPYLKKSSSTVGAPEVCVYMYVSMCAYGEANHVESESRNIISLSQNTLIIHTWSPHILRG